MSKKSLPIVAIVGRANVGKSSLFNRLAEERRAIVADVAGTTRDSVFAKAQIGAGHCWLVDTAGLKKPDSDLELSIQDQIDQATDSATVIIVVVEAQIGITTEDRNIAKKALQSKHPVILVVNKHDKAIKRDLTEFNRLGIKDIVNVSTVHATGLEELEDKINHLLPTVKQPDEKLLKVALLGRPNVGKSMMFNLLTGTNRAIVSDTAGTTRDVNRAVITRDGKEFEIMDTAGIRKRSKSGKGIEYYSSLRTLAAIEEADVCILLIDALEPATKIDQKIAGMVKDSGRGLIIALNKWDLIEKDENTFDQMAGSIGYEFLFVSWARLMPTSAVDGKNSVKLLDIAAEIGEQRTKKIPTNDLNKWLRAVVSHHPPAGLKNSHPRLKYITQVDEEPPTFRIFGSTSKLLHWSYKRFMERELRAKFDFSGTAVKFLFTDREPRSKS